eukprot:CAMPEP_0201692944 /NCGR_PEP_ID=MMETSP0578-20130828/5702_1 /ASSEMBLY_ACC=CAM_ASM_000663 /TAXON_ID=267565 /ORGANISM="Skeletonema grethea, Strain CCMP 1804" /LENGTH=454 /DNA_ID=CAMNT_0048178401 /DNA_START=59 /DNA_END=1423 /DNA_ORIENTATION=-
MAVIDPPDDEAAAAAATATSSRRPIRLDSIRTVFMLSIAVTCITAFFMTNAASMSYEQTKIKEQSSFSAPHAQIRHNNDSSLSFATGDTASNEVRRNLSEPEGRPLPSQALNNTELKKKAEQKYEEKKKEEQPQQSNNRPSGVVYEYIEPPPINLTARAQLSNKFRLGVPDLTNTNTSTALCGIVKDAEAYLDEWVDYHFGLGFHSIYLIDNSDKHELKSWQDKRRNAGYSVRVLPKPGTHRQMYGYHMCAAEFKNDHTYMAFFDVDEFLVLKKHNRVDDMLADHLKEGSLGVSWFIFGSGDTSTYAPLPVTKRFLYRDGGWKDTHHQQWKIVKSILKLEDYGGYPKSPHSMKTKRGTWKDTNGGGTFNEIGAVNEDRPTDVAVIHHYKYLSPKEFYWKSCVRKTVDDKFKGCSNDKQDTVESFKGSSFDDSAWELLKKNVPRYAMYDEFEDFM